jgi:hypothetical protein
VTISATYTAGGGADATANADSGFQTYADSVLTALGGNYEIVGEGDERGETDKELVRTHRYQEVLYKQAGAATLLSDSIIQQEMAVSIGRATRRVGVGVGNVEFPRTGSVRYSAFISASAASAWSTTRDAIVSLIDEEVASRLSSLGGGSAIKRSINVELSRDTRRVSASVDLWVVTSTAYLDYTITTRVSIDPGVVLLPVWTGSGLSRYRYDGPRQITATTTEVIVQPWGAQPPPLTADDVRGLGGRLQPPPAGRDGQWVQVGPQTYEDSPSQEIDAESGNTQAVIEERRIVTWQLVEIVGVGT